MKKKILFIIPSLTKGGGAERVASELSIHLFKKYNINILTFKTSNQIYRFKGDLYSLSETYSFPKKYLVFLIRFYRIYRIITKTSPDLIISFMEISNIYSILTNLFFKLKTPLIITTHCNPSIVYLKNMRYFNILIKLFYPLKIVNKIITISREVKNILNFDFKIPRNKISSIYNAIDLDKISRLKEKQVEAYQTIFRNKNLIKYITIGRLEELKGHSLLINSFREVLKQIPDSKLIIIGEGPLKKTLKNQINELKLNHYVILMGYVSNPFKYLNKADVFILTSYYEGLPLVLLEALACGLPIISTDCPTGPKEILDDGKFGILVRVGDSRQLAEKMTWLAKNKNERESLKSRSIQRAKYFNYDIIEKQWIDIIESI